jgi:hypothetical protein
VNTYIFEHFPFKNRLIDLIGILNELTGDSPNINKAFRGKAGWLFLGNDHHRTVDALIGKDVGGASRQYAFKLINDLATRCREAGAPFTILVGPNKHSIYPEFLPDWLKPCSTGVKNRLTVGLEKNGIPVFDPTVLLTSSKQAGVLYYRTDTHWNMLAGSIVFEGWRHFLKTRLALDLPQPAPYSLHPAPPYRGDLVAIGNFFRLPINTGDNFTLEWATPYDLIKYVYSGQPFDAMINQVSSRKGDQQFFADNQTQHNNDGDTIIVIENQASLTPLTLVSFGDSFTQSLSPFFHNIFRRTIYINKYASFAFTTEMLKKINADLIIWLTVERSYIAG